MNDVARRLDELAARLDFPPTPELAPGVLARLAARRRRRRRALVVALTALALVAAALAVSPGARSAIADWLGIGGVRIVRVDELPVAPRHGIEPFLGERASLAEAQRRVAFAVARPRGHGMPDEVYVRAYPPGGAVTLVWGSRERPRLVLTQWSGRTVEPVLLKSLPPGARAEELRVDGERAAWIDGAPHTVVSAGRTGEYEDTLWLAGNVLVWERGARAFRLEADIDRDDALRLAAETR